MMTINGRFLLSPEGSAWIYAEIHNGKMVAMAEEANLATHIATNDRFAFLGGVIASQAKGELKDVTDDVAQAIVREVMGDDVSSDMVFVERIPETKTVYALSGSGGTETAESLEDAIEMASVWYQWMIEQDMISSEDLPELNTDGIKTVSDLNKEIGKLEEKIAEAMGAKSFAGHGNYFVSAADSIGLDLLVTEETREL